MAHAALPRLAAAPALSSQGPAAHRWRYTARRALLLAISSLFLAAEQPAHAVVQTLSSASLSITFSTLPVIPLTWSGTGSADVTATSITGLTAGIFNFTGTIPVTDPGAFPIAGLAVVGATNGVGNFSGVDTSSGGGLMAVKGLINSCLFASCAAPPQSNVTIPFTAAGANGVGLGGSPVSFTGLVNVTVHGTQWTTGTATVGSTSQSGSPFSGGSVKLVSAATIRTNIGPGVDSPLFAILNLTFIPEPGTMLLLGSGLVGLAAARGLRPRGPAPGARS